MIFSYIRKRWEQAALYRAIDERDVGRIEELAREGLDLKSVRGALSRAVWRLDWKVSDRRVVDVLLAHGALANNPGNETLLQGAARIGDHELIDLALSAGHDIHCGPPDGPSALQVAAYRNKPATIKYLSARGATKDDFRVSCSWTSINAETIAALLKLGVPVPADVVEDVQAGRKP